MLSLVVLLEFWRSMFAGYPDRDVYIGKRGFGVLVAESLCACEVFPFMIPEGGCRGRSCSIPAFQFLWFDACCHGRSRCPHGFR